LFLFEIRAEFSKQIKNFIDIIKACHLYIHIKKSIFLMSRSDK